MEGEFEVLGEAPPTEWSFWRDDAPVILGYVLAGGVGMGLWTLFDAIGYWSWSPPS